MKASLHRSYLATPASSTQMLPKAAASPADVVIVDLEDGVSVDQKGAARTAAASACAGTRWAGRGLAVRINSPGSGLALEDLSEMITHAGAHIDAVVVPKVLSERDVWWVDTTLTELETRTALGHRIAIQVLIEDVAALENLPAIARCSGRIESLAFGPGDFSASMGVDLAAAGNDSQDLYPGDVWHFARAAISSAAHAAGVVAVDGAYGRIHDVDGYTRECTWARTLGFGGKWAIHPGQTEVANRIFTPSADAVAAAERMLAAYDAAEQRGDGAATHEGHLVDAATLRTARVVVETATAISAAAAVHERTS